MLSFISDFFVSVLELDIIYFLIVPLFIYAVSLLINKLIF